MLREPVDIIIPTMDNLNQLTQCLQSVIAYYDEYPMRIIVVNNGHKGLGEQFSNSPCVEFVETGGENLGWIGGLKLGLERSKSKYVMFANDDIFIPRASYLWLRYMVRDMEINPKFGAIGPSTNVAMGVQNIWAGGVAQRYYTNFLIGFCMLVRRDALDEAGGVQDMEFGGDDLDLSIRLRKAGYFLIVKRDTFIYHHGFQTGQKVHGTPDKPNGWNSREMTDNTNMEIIRKHGLREWWFTLTQKPDITALVEVEDAEGACVRKYIRGNGSSKILELGCGHRKTVDHAVGVDRVPKGEEIPYLPGSFSVADITADAVALPLEGGSQDTVIARHVLEHCIDPVKALREWKRVLNPYGRMIITCPDDRVGNGIPMNPEHMHAYTADSLASLADVVGLRETGRETNYNGVSFMLCLEKAKS